MYLLAWTGVFDIQNKEDYKEKNIQIRTIFLSIVVSGRFKSKGKIVYFGYK